MTEPKTVARLVEVGERVLSDSSHLFEDHDFRAEAEDLLAFCLNVDGERLEDDFEPPPRARERYLSLVARRAAGEPLPLLTGHIEFYGLDLKVRPGAFMPRPSSELTVEHAARRLRRRQRPVAVDLCTGTGPIALGIAWELPDAEVWATDVSEEGLRQGRVNARRLGIDNVRFRKGDMFGALPRRLQGAVDLITGHIPYVPPGEVDDLPSEVKDHEPLYTLTDTSPDGLSLIRHAVSEAPAWLKPGGWLVLEVSDDLVSKVRRLCVKAGYEGVREITDDDHLSVVIEGRKNRS